MAQVSRQSCWKTNHYIWGGFGKKKNNWIARKFHTLIFGDINPYLLFVVFPQSHSPLLRTLRDIKQWNHQTEVDTYAFESEKGR